MMSDSSYADETNPGTGTSSVTFEDYSIGQGKKTTATLSFYDATSYSSVSWTAKMVDSKGTSQSSALSSKAAAACFCFIVFLREKRIADSVRRHFRYLCR